MKPKTRMGMASEATTGQIFFCKRTSDEVEDVLKLRKGQVTSGRELG
jgi:hypothetical protein